MGNRTCLNCGNRREPTNPEDPCDFSKILNTRSRSRRHDEIKIREHFAKDGPDESRSLGYVLEILNMKAISIKKHEMELW